MLHIHIQPRAHHAPQDHPASLFPACTHPRELFQLSSYEAGTSYRSWGLWPILKFLRACRVESSAWWSGQVSIPLTVCLPNPSFFSVQRGRLEDAGGSVNSHTLIKVCYTLSSALAHRASHSVIPSRSHMMCCAGLTMTGCAPWPLYWLRWSWLLQSSLSHPPGLF